MRAWPRASPTSGCRARASPVGPPVPESASNAAGSLATLSRMRVLVTGGAGFIGSHFVRRLVDGGDQRRRARQADVCGQSREPRGRSTTSSSTATSPIPWSSRRPTAGCDAIVNFAAETHVDRSILGPTEFVHTDVLGTMCLLEAARETGARFVQVSTDEVYGDLEAGGRALEGDPLRPSSPYSAAKAGGDLQVLAYVRTYGVRASITRGANTYGPNQYPEKLVPLFTTNALEGEPLPVYGDGKQVREWLHAEDHCAGIELVLHEGAPGEVYNVGGEDHENIEITHRILELTGADPVARPPRRGSGGARPAVRARRFEAPSARLGAPALVRRGRPPCDGRLVSRESLLVGADQVGRVPRLLRRAVRKPAQGLSRLTENSSVRYLTMRRILVPILSLALAGDRRCGVVRPTVGIDDAGSGDVPCRLRSTSSRAADTGTASASTSTERSRQAKANRGYREILSFYYPGTELTKAAATKVRVLLAEGRTSVKLGSAVPFSVRDGSGVVTELEPGEITLEARPPCRRGRQADAAPGPSRASCRARERCCSSTARSIEERSDSPPISGALQVIDVLGLDAYLLGVVPGEVPKEWPAAALQAQAVAARSYALASIVKSRPFDLYSDTRSQVYYGVSAEAPATTTAVKATRGRDPQLRRQGRNDVLLLVVGGRTASSKDVFGVVTPYLQTRDDPWDTLSPYHRWAPRSFTAATLGQAFRLSAPVVDVQVEPTDSGRPLSVTLIKKTGANVLLRGADVRATLGLRSTAFRLGVLRIGLPSPSTAAGGAGRHPRRRPRCRGTDAREARRQRQLAAVRSGSKPGADGDVRRDRAAEAHDDLPARRGRRAGPALTVTVAAEAGRSEPAVDSRAARAGCLRRLACLAAPRAHAARYAVGVAQGASSRAVAARLRARGASRIVDLRADPRSRRFRARVGGPAARPSRCVVRREASSQGGRRTSRTTRSFTRQWYAASESRRSTSGPSPHPLASVRVAVIDSGIDGRHPELRGRIVAVEELRRRDPPRSTPRGTGRSSRA